MLVFWIVSFLPLGIGPMFLRPLLLWSFSLTTGKKNRISMAASSSQGHSKTTSTQLSSSTSEPPADPSHVWKQANVANTFTDIRESVPLHQEQLDLMVRIIRHFVVSPSDDDDHMTWLDLGCGDGPLSRKLLEEFPEADGILLDFSEPMLQAAQSKIESINIRSNRVNYVTADLSDPQWMDNLPTTTRKSINVICSSFAIHHLTDERKKALYQEIHNLLSPGGVFLNLEHVASPDQKVEKLFDGAFVDSMYAHFQERKSVQECQQAVEYDLSVDDDANLLAPVESQCEWLREVGFQHVDCYFKFLILAMFGGVKGGAREG